MQCIYCIDIQYVNNLWVRQVHLMSLSEGQLVETVNNIQSDRFQVKDPPILNNLPSEAFNAKGKTKLKQKQI